MTQMHWSSSAATHRGAVRKINEDAFLNRHSDGLWAVADGMGGHEAGEVASSMITSALQSVDVAKPFAAVVDALEDALLDVHTQIRNYSRSHCEGRTMGSTVVSLYAQADIGVCLWAGDSRLYRFRDRKLSAVSEDHSQVNEMLVRGMITADEAVNHPASNVITRAVGASEDLFVDVTLVELQQDDIFLLCSDGLFGALSEQQIAAQLNGSTIDDVPDRLVEQALQAGARDNVTIVVVQIQ